MKVKPANLLLFVLIAFACLIIVMISNPPPTSLYSTTHPEFETMMKSGDPYTGNYLVFGTLFGICIVGVLLSIFMFALKNINAPERSKAVRFIIVVCAVYGSILLTLGFLDTDETPTIIMGMPAATALMLYGIGLFPVVLSAAFVIKFDKWVVDKERLENFYKMISKNK